MRWRDGRRSDNVEDRRGITAGKVVGGGIGVVIVTIVAMLLGVDPSQLLNMFQEEPAPTKQVSSRSAQKSPQQSSQDDPLADFVSVVLADTEDTWNDLFQQMNRAYQDPKLVLFTGAVDSACGYAQAAMGPFYCPADYKVYIDLSFYHDLQTRFKAPGDFAQAYVIAHEVGHHVQNLLGISQKVQALQQQATKVEANQLSVRQELQADCLAGVWANHANKARQIIEQGDIAEALNAATAIGDDRLQKQAKGYVTPDSFTHGSSEQRMRWFKRGIEKGDLGMCNTFDVKQL